MRLHRGHTGSNGWCPCKKRGREQTQGHTGQEGTEGRWAPGRGRGAVSTGPRGTGSRGDGRASEGGVVHTWVWDSRSPDRGTVSFCC